MVLPHSSASVERIFSLVNYVKTKKLVKAEAGCGKCKGECECKDICMQILWRKTSIVKTQAKALCTDIYRKPDIVGDAINELCHQRYIKLREQRKSDPNIYVNAANKNLEEDL